MGKEPGGSVQQRDIGAELVARAQRGQTVVRLKGGDPFVFGRGGEEAEVLRAAGIRYEVVPGITAGIAAPAYAGIPVTHRDAASAVAFVTGHEDPDKPESVLDWEALARFPGTLVFYMGVKALPRIADALTSAGRASDEPAAVIERGTLPGQRTVLATLATIADAATEAAIRPPSITVVGPVAALAERLRWLDDRPLNGRSIAVTRARAQASGLAARLRALGAEVVEAPAIRIVAAARRRPRPRRHRPRLPDLAQRRAPALRTPARRRLDARALHGRTVAAIGPGTARALREHGIEPDVVPERSVAESLVEALAPIPVTRALIARAAEARDVLPDALRERGARVDVLPLYETVAEQLDADARTAALEADYITFTSSSTVTYFLDAAGGPPGADTRIVSIGPVTTATLREHGLQPHVEARRHDIEGVISAILEDA